MTRTIIERDHEVVLIPERPLFVREYDDPVLYAALMRQNAEEVRQSAQRHVDGLGQAAMVRYTRAVYCALCGRVDDSLANVTFWPDCCDAAQVEFVSEHREKSREWFLMNAGCSDPDYLDELLAATAGGSR